MSLEQKECDCTPRLRFPAFLEHPWECYYLDQLIAFGKNAINSRADLTDNGDINYIHYGDIHTKFNYVIDFSRRDIPYLKKDVLVQADFLDNGDLIIADASEDMEGVGKAAEIYNLPNCKKAIAGLHTILLKPYKNIFYKFFLSYVFSSEYVKSQIDKVATGTKVYSVSKKSLKSIILPRPALAEQQKIADCLSSLDELIEAREQKCNALRQHKKGLMQRLFPAEGETTPRWRFPEFQDFEAWKLYEVGALFTVTRGEVLSMTKIKSTLTKPFIYPVYSSQTKNNGLAGFYSKYLYEDAITWTTDGANAGDVKFRKGKFYCTNVCGVLLNRDGYANECIAELLNYVSKNYVSYVGNPKLMNNVMKKIEIPFPSLSEQQKIADCLSAIDERIAAEEDKIAALREHRKGLMQQLFPVM